ncbi:MAG: hypothetical protein E7546_03990 [Ruminococcaceae bacterium]|nr:hypothetical protein [Oscillospiraceae bacterium]
MKKIILILASLLMVLLCACADRTDEPLDAQDNTAAASQSDAEVLEENKYYKITSQDFMYSYLLYDDESEVVKTETVNKRPHIDVVDGDIVRVVFQSGTGIGTQQGYYYDPKNDVFSQTFSAIFDDCSGVVAHGTGNRVIVRDIFSDTVYAEIEAFSKPFAEVAYPFVGAQFSSDGSSIDITYISGDHYEEITENFKLK